MSTIYDTGPVPEPNDAELDAFGEAVRRFEAGLTARLGRRRADALLDWWHVDELARALDNGFERTRARRLLSDLNEELRQLQVESGREDRFWVLIPTREP